MGSKLIPRYQDGGLLMGLPYNLQTKYQVKPGTSLAETALLKARNAQSPNMLPIQPISLSNSTAGAATGLGKAPFQSLDTKTLASSATKATTGIDASGIGTIANGVTALGIGAIDAFSKAPAIDQFGIQTPESPGNTTAKSTLSGLGSGAATGAAIGSVIPGIGTAIGAVAGGLIGGATGFFKGKKEAESAKDIYSKNNSAAYGKFYGNQYANQFQAMMGKDGMKLKTARVMQDVKPSSKLAPRVSDINIIASGKLHKENNNLGNKDKGIPVVNKKGKKIFELEKEELILNLNATKHAENLVNNYNKHNNGDTLEELGRFVHNELMNNTQDNSKKFGLEV